ncbi:MAG: germination protein Ger(X)C family [Eubacterium sp.]|nr:germination protein Ger(X)C family [Eubacterium sp.]
MTKKIIAVLLIIGIMFSGTGCWNNRDLSELSILTALAIDKKDDGMIEVTAQIIKPGNVSTSGAGSGGGADEKKSFVTVSETDRTVFAALRGMLSKVNNKIFYSSSQVIVFGEELARSGIQEYIDFILRDHETQYKSMIIVSKGATAKEIVGQEYDLSKIPGAFIRDTLKNSESRGFSKKLILLEMARELATEGRELSIGTIEKQDKITNTEGLAVFKEDKIAGWLDKYETRGYAFITDRIRSAIIEIKNPDDPQKVIAIENMKAVSNIKPKLVNGKIEIDINIKISANIGEQQSQIKEKHNEFCSCVGKELDRTVMEECIKTIEKCRKEYRSDIFGFGMRVFDEYPDYWEKNSKKWNDEIFPTVRINVKVKSKIMRTGLLGNSIKIQ